MIGENLKIAVVDRPVHRPIMDNLPLLGV